MQGGNPMVASFQDDLDPDDQAKEKPLRITAKIPNNTVLLSSEDEEEPNVSINEDFDFDKKMNRCSKNEFKCHPESAFTKFTDQKHLSSSSPPNAPEKNSNIFSPELLNRVTLAPYSAAAPGEKTCPSEQISMPQHKVDLRREKAESDSEFEGPIATQLLSFVMDDPDFDSEDSDKAAKKVDDFPVREDISDISEEDLDPGKQPEDLKPTTVQSFKLKNDSDLFGLGINEKAKKESSDEAAESKSHSKEKKKKKKKTKEPQEEDKSSKKKSKPKKAKGKEEEKEDKKKRKKKTKENNEFDELEAFLGGGDGIVKARAGEEYEEL